MLVKRQSILRKGVLGVAVGLRCPACGEKDLDVCNYESMMVLRNDIALFTLRCPKCAARISSVQTIPLALREEVRFAAIEVGAGMGRE